MRGGRREAQRAHDERDGGRVPGPRQCLEEDRLSTEHVKPLRGSVTEEEGESGTKITLDNAALSDMAKDRAYGCWPAEAHMSALSTEAPGPAPPAPAVLG